jgi:hypothetical protein
VLHLMDGPSPDMDAGLSGRQQEAPQAQRTGMNEMNNDALVAALGMDAVAAVHGYRLAVRDEAAERGIYLVSEQLSGVIVVSPGECVIVDPIDIRLAFVHTSGRRGLAGRTLTWDPGARLGNLAPHGERAAVFLRRSRSIPAGPHPHATAGPRLGRR